MDKYLINKNRLNMFNRIAKKTENIEYSEEAIKIFFDYIISEIEKNINKPYALFKHLQATFSDEDTRELFYDEIIMYYLDSGEPYVSFNDKTNLDLFLILINEEESRLFDKLGFGYDCNELLHSALEMIQMDLDCIPILSEKRDYLLEKKMSFTMNLNSELVRKIDELLLILDKQIENIAVYIDLLRINDLRHIINANLDTTRLIQLCEELNQAYRTKNYITIPILVRAIIDHVPPVFGKTGFKEVIAQCGTRSFKESMTHLDSSLRKIADANIHTQIRNKENLPSHTQIDFRADLDVLLAEVCRILK